MEFDPSDSQDNKNIHIEDDLNTPPMSDSAYDAES